MYWEERIDWIRQAYQLAPADFKVHHTDWVDIMQKIEAKFVVKQNANQHFNHWSDNLKGQKVNLDLNCHHRQFFDALFNEEINYWFVLLYSNAPSAKHLLYDCKLKVIDILLTYKPNRDFFIIDKKYHWLYYFNKGEDFNIKRIIASGEVDDKKLKELLKACA